MNLPRILIPAAIGFAAVAGVAGGSLINALHANAAAANTGSSSNVTQQSAQHDPTKGGHVGANGVREVLLTGDTAAKAKAAALTAVPGGTIVRVENDAEGATYEAHMTKPDGSFVTVKMDGNFKVTGVEAGFGSRRQPHP